MRDALRRYELEAEPTRERGAAFATALRAVQENAALRGTHRLSRREINAEIAAVRKSQKASTAGSA